MHETSIVSITKSLGPNSDVNLILNRVSNQWSTGFSPVAIPLYFSQQQRIQQVKKLEVLSVKVILRNHVKSQNLGKELMRF